LGFNAIVAGSQPTRGSTIDPVRASVDWLDTCSHAAEVWWTRVAGNAAVAAAAGRRTDELLRFARANSPFYRERWAALPKDRLSLSDLPVVTKPELMARFDDWATDRSVTETAVREFVADRAHIGDLFLDKYLVWKSSGSTGEPGVYVQDRAALAVYDALLAVQMQSARVATRYALGFFAQGGRAALVVATGDHFASIASWQRVCRGTPWPNASAFCVTDSTPSLVAKLNAYSPAFLASYPTTLTVLATEQLEGRLKIAPTCIWSGGEYLSDSTCEAVERAFGTLPINEYGASECMAIAYSCSEGRLHVNSDWVVLEPVDRNYQPTPVGEASHTVLLTNLANRVQPIIRYDLGDSVTVSAQPCRCGSPLPAIRAEGRRDDVLALRARDGTLVRLSPLALTTVVEDAAPNDRFQLVQSAPDQIDVRLGASEPEKRNVEWRAVQRALTRFLAQQSLDNVHLHLDAQAPVADPRSGKAREVIARSEGAES
jgi:phenylacetate-coenzyme A ligase PaaK-like adenylate-forming protein